MNKKLKIVSLILVIATCLSIGTVLGITITQLSPETKGFFGIQEQNSQLQVLSFQNQIQNPMKLRTTITMRNPSGTSISFNATISFYNVSGIEILNYTLSDTLNAGQQKNYINTNTVNVTAWDNTGIDITATA